MDARQWPESALGKRARASCSIAVSLMVAEPGKALAPAPAPRHLKPRRWLLALFSLMIGGCVEREYLNISNDLDEKEESLMVLKDL